MRHSYQHLKGLVYSLFEVAAVSVLLVFRCCTTRTPGVILIHVSLRMFLFVLEFMAKKLQDCSRAQTYSLMGDNAGNARSGD